MDTNICDLIPYMFDPCRECLVKATCSKTCNKRGAYDMYLRSKDRKRIQERQLRMKQMMRFNRSIKK